MRIKYNGHILTKAGLVGSAAFTGEQPAPSLPPYTIRLKFNEGVTPTFTYGTGVQVSSSPNVWDLTYENTAWNVLLRNQTDLLEVIAANTAGITNMAGMFYGCTSLTAVPLFDTASVTRMATMFYDCRSLTSIPLFDTSSVTIMSSMCYGCVNVQSGALALYQQASSQATVPSHTTTFANCGLYTVTGAAELAQIPTSWGGTMQ